MLSLRMCNGGINRKAALKFLNICSSDEPLFESVLSRWLNENTRLIGIEMVLGLKVGEMMPR